MTDNPPTPETARALLRRHGLPEDVIDSVLDSVLDYHAQELASAQRAFVASHGLIYPGTIREVINSIDPAHSDTPAVSSAVPVPPTTTTADRAALAEDLRYVLDYRGPGHAHEKPGVWDTSGKPCDHCARLAIAREHLAAYDADPGAVLPPPADRAALDRVRALHLPKPDGSGFPDGMQCRTCSHDGDDGYQYLVPWPCPTVEAVDEELRRVADEAQQQPDTKTREWCKCRSCWGWFVEAHPGEDLDELGKDLSWWSGLPVHRDAPADVQQPAAADSGDRPDAYVYDPALPPLQPEPVGEFEIDPADVTTAADNGEEAGRG